MFDMLNNGLFLGKLHEVCISKLTDHFQIADLFLR